MPGENLGGAPNAGVTLQQPPLAPTFYGYLKNTIDALILLTACLDGELNHVPRRPHDRERADLIRSGNIFIYEENASGIKRWTDGVSWSPSRILNNYLIYRELERPFPAGEKKRAMRKPSHNGVNSRTHSSTPGSTRSNSVAGLSNALLNFTTHQPGQLPVSPSPFGGTANPNDEKDTERSLVGSLVDSYSFKEGGLVKKTISVTHRGITHHIVSYYSVEDAKQGRLPSPSDSPQFQGKHIRDDLMSGSFRAPLHESEIIMSGGAINGTPAAFPSWTFPSSMAPAIPQFMNGINGSNARSMSVPNVGVTYAPMAGQWHGSGSQTTSSPATSGFPLIPDTYGMSTFNTSNALPPTTTYQAAAPYSAMSNAFSHPSAQFSHEHQTIGQSTEYRSTAQDGHLEGFSGLSSQQMELQPRRQSEMNGHQENQQNLAQVPFNDGNATHGLENLHPFSVYDSESVQDPPFDPTAEDYDGFNTSGYGDDSNELGNMGLTGGSWSSNSMPPSQI